MECSCDINSDCDNFYYEVITTYPIAVREEWQCEECYRIIEEGEKFERAIGYMNIDEDNPEEKEEGKRHITCMDCVSLRNGFFGDWTYGKLWEDFSEYLFECRAELPEACISKITAMAREKVCEKIEEHWEYQMDREEDE